MRTPARKSRIPRVNTYGRYYGMGKQAEDALSGWYFPVSQMTKQRGRKISADPKDGSLDKPDTY